MSDRDGREKCDDGKLLDVDEVDISTYWGMCCESLDGTVFQMLGHSEAR